jgi:hypothetical protein
MPAALDRINKIYRIYKILASGSRGAVSQTNSVNFVNSVQKKAWLDAPESGRHTYFLQPLGKSRVIVDVILVAEEACFFSSLDVGG